MLTSYSFVKRMRPGDPAGSSTSALALLSLTAIAVPLVHLRAEFYWTKVATAAVLLGAAVLIAHRQLGGELLRRRLLASTLAPVLIFSAFALLSTLWSTNPHRGVRPLILIGLGVIAYVLALVWPVDAERLLTGFFGAITVTSALVSVYGAAQYYQVCERLGILGPRVQELVRSWSICTLPVDRYGNPSPAATLGLGNFAAEYVLMALPLAGALLVLSRSRLRAIATVSLLLGLHFIAISRNRASYLGIIAIATLLSLVTLVRALRAGKLQRRALPRVMAAAVAAVMVAAGLLVATPLGRTVRERFASMFDPAESTVESRLEVWKGALRMAADHPLVGVGAGNFAVHSWAYLTPRLEGLTLERNTAVEEAHNELLQVLCEGGLVGLAIFGWLFLVGARRIKQAVTAAPLAGAERAAALALAAGLTANLVTACFSFPLQRPATLLYAAIYLGLIEAIAGRSPARPGAGMGDRPASDRGAGARRPRALGGVAAAVGAAGFCAVAAFHALTQVRAERYYLAGTVLQQQHRNREALAAYDRAHAFDPYREWVLYNRAYVNLALGDGAGALADLRRCAELAPRYGKLRRELAGVLYRQGRAEEALAELEVAATLTTVAAPSVYAAMCQIHLDRGDAGAVARCAERWFAAGCGDADSCTKLASLYRRLGRPDRAEQCLATR